MIFLIVTEYLKVIKIKKKRFIYLVIMKFDQVVKSDGAFIDDFGF